MESSCCSCLGGVGVQSRNNVSERLRRDLRASQGGHTHNIGQLVAANGSGGELKDYYDVSSFVQLGAGGFGQVYKAKLLSTGQERAVKRIEKGETNPTEMVSTELACLLTLDHPHVCKMFEWFEDEFSVYIVTELVTGSNLGSFTLDKRVKVLFRQLLTALSYCHKKNICHRDLKMDNCLVNDCIGEELMVKVIDFGLAAVKKRTESEQEWLNTALGTPLYMSPAVVNRAVKYGVKCDIWSLGVILYMLLTGEHPFCESEAEKRDLKLLFRRIQYDEIRRGPFNQNHVSDLEQDLIRLLLTKECLKRPHASELLLTHPWLSTKVDDSCLPVTRQHLAWAMVYCDQSDDFEKRLLSVLALEAYDRKEIAHMRQSFENLDMNHDGHLYRDDLRRAFAKSGIAISEDTIDKVFAALDTDGSDAIEYTQWLAATLPSELIESLEGAKAVMEFFRERGESPKITTPDLEKFLGDQKTVKEVLQRWDKDGDGCLSLHELRAVFTNIGSQRRKASESVK